MGLELELKEIFIPLMDLDMRIGTIDLRWD